MSDDLPAADLCPVLTAWADVMGGEEAITYAEDGDAMEQLEATLRAAADRIEANAQTIEKANDRAQVLNDLRQGRLVILQRDFRPKLPLALPRHQA